MKNVYKIIDEQGDVHEVEGFFKKRDSELSGKFHKIIEREMGIGEAPMSSKNEKPKYLKYAEKLGFSWENNADAGHVNYDHKAYFMMRQVEALARKLVNKIGFPIHEVRGANMFNMSHPVVESYAKLYGDRLYHVDSGDNELVMSYDCSYPQFNLAAKKVMKESDLPFAHFSISDCYRQEQSGECMLLFRQRRFFMPDIHPYFKDVAQAFEWFPKIEKGILEAGDEANIKYEMVIEVSSEENWEKYKDEICQVAKNFGRPAFVNIICDQKSRYWIINVDYKILDNLGQSREIACIQIDIGNAERLNIKYRNNNGEEKYPAIIHSAVPGGIERYLYMILDNYSESMPFWLYPVQFKVASVSEKFNQFALAFNEKLNEMGYRSEVDISNDVVSKKVKRGREELVKEVLVCGEKEQKLGLEKLVNEIERRFPKGILV